MHAPIPNKLGCLPNPRVRFDPPGRGPRRSRTPFLSSSARDDTARARIERVDGPFALANQFASLVGPMLNLLMGSPDDRRCYSLNRRKDRTMRKDPSPVPSG